MSEKTPAKRSQTGTKIVVRPARTSDIRKIADLMQPMIEERILLGKDLVVLYEHVQEFVIAEVQKLESQDPSRQPNINEPEIAGFGALHVMWEHLGEIRSIATVDKWRGRGVGKLLMDELENRAQQLGLSKLFCLTFETGFFSSRGFGVLEEATSELLEADVYAELLRSTDDGVAEFLDLARVKQNTLGNTRMLKRL